MNTIIRCHIKNDQRLQTLERTLKSFYDKKMDELGQLYIVDDQSPMSAFVMGLAAKYNAIYKKTEGDPDTKNGLYWSLKVQDKFPALLCVDDMVFGEGTKERFEKMLNEEIPQLPINYGIIGTFACYENPTRIMNKVQGTDLWKWPYDIYYATVAALFSENLAKTIMYEWEAIKAGSKMLPNCCDDIWLKELCRGLEIPLYNTFQDYAQHTGINQRSFSDNNQGSEYVTNMFVGE